ncbi:VOC family protein [Actinoplanes aureus]|uniref:VOC family protein n=1 Tax=Actinoplanes aureus TaxID=2792083 RepID=A0A931G3R0_9ACTN|nr:VOC family protein [Actinoplanes aureus]MBG0564509.1 VOC family protein [Actinoplanes aureus]
MRLDHVGLTVGDLDRMRDWYATALGLTPEFDFALPEHAFRGVLLRGAGYRLELLERAGSTGRPSPEPGVRMAYLADPEGSLVELLDRGRAAGAS